MTNQENLIELTNKLYHLTLLFPKKEPLRYKLREIADEILADFTCWQVLNSEDTRRYGKISEGRNKEIVLTIEKNLKVLNSYFEVAKWQNWVNYFEVLEIQGEYDMIRSNLEEKIKKVENEEKSGYGFKDIAPATDFVSEKMYEETKTDERKEDLESREEKIINILSRVEKIQVGEINKLFPEVSKRTIRRDCQKMVKEGLIERIGEKNNTYYKIKTS